MTRNAKPLGIASVETRSPDVQGARDQRTLLTFIPLLDRRDRKEGRPRPIFWPLTSLAEHAIFGGIRMDGNLESVIPYHFELYMK